MESWREGTVQTNGIQVHYHHTGGDKPPVVLAHGITDNGLCWRPLARVLQDEYDLFMVDARGHGLSDKPEHGYTPDIHAADIAGLIEALDLGQPAVMGHSMGGATMTALAALYPDQVKCAVLEDPPWREENESSNEERTQRMQAWAQSTRERSSLPVEEIIRQGKQDNSTWDDDEFPAWAEAKRQVGLHVFTGALEMRRSWQELVPLIRCPTLLVTGDTELGAIVSPQMAEQVKKLNPDIEVAHVPGAGHNIRRTQFDAFVASVRSFLAKNA